jgi:hypothetical protein
MIAYQGESAALAGDATTLANLLGVAERTPTAAKA